MGVCCPVIRTRDRLLLNLPCLSDPVGRSSLFLKLALVALHLVFIGFLLVCDAQFIEKTRLHPWYMSSYFFFFSATLVQYFVTSGSSPGYVIDAMRDVDETNAIMYRNAPTTSLHTTCFQKNWERSDYCRRRISIRWQKDSKFLAEDGYGLVPSWNLFKKFDMRVLPCGAASASQALS